MRLESIRISNFRNHKHLEFEPGPSITVIHGRNGSGKTSILEAVHYCALTRGLAGSTDRECLAFGEDHFSIRGSFTSDRGTELDTKVTYTPDKEKQVFVNEQEVMVFSRHIGTIPCVTFTPHELSIVTGGPAERRRFIDSSICQYDRRYLSDLIQYRRVLHQRNALLSDVSTKNANRVGLEIWTEQLAIHAAAIVRTRVHFMGRFMPLFREFYSWMPEKKDAEIFYQSTLGDIDNDESIEEISERFKDKYRDLMTQELHRKQTLAGPHRDDLRLNSDGYDIRKYASQGQQRSYLVSMKMALRQHLHENLGETPLTLLDDLFSELDDDVTGRILDAITGSGQVMITATHERTGSGMMAYHMQTGV